MRYKTPILRSLLLSALLLSSCTLVKPVVCTFTWPVLLLGGEHDLGPVDLGDCYGQSGDQVAVALAALLVLPGPVGGLITGVISDWNVVTGQSIPGDPARNFFHPMKTNLSRK